jgi:hypothetical protein
LVIKHRAFLSLPGRTALAWPSAAWAQEPAPGADPRVAAMHLDTVTVGWANASHALAQTAYRQLPTPRRRGWDDTYRDEARPFVETQLTRAVRPARWAAWRRARAARRRSEGHAAAHQIGRQFRQPGVVVVGPAALDCDIAALDTPRFAQALKKCGRRIRSGRAGMEKTFADIERRAGSH